MKKANAGQLHIPQPRILCQLRKSLPKETTLLNAPHPPNPNLAPLSPLDHRPSQSFKQPEMETLTIKRNIQQSVTIPLPYYAKSPSGDRYWAVLSERTALCVVTRPECEGIYNSVAGSIIEDAEQISEEAFAQAFQKAKLALDKQFAETCPSLQVAA